MTTDILAIGDITTDIFINIHEDNEHCLVDAKNEKLIFDFGEKIPYDSAETVKATGNGGNAAVSGARLGLSAALLSRIGDDKDGKECLDELRKNNVDATLVRAESGKKTNCHYVLWYEVDRTILTRHENFSYEFGEVEPPRWIYLTSLPENSLDFHNQIADFAKKNPSVKLAFQPGTYQIKFGAEKLAEIYKRAEIFFCNVQEAREILRTSETDLPTLLAEIAALGPKIVCVTDGINGAYAFDSVKNEKWFVPCYPGKPFERTGAGDAFASTVVAALALGEPLQTALLWAPINAMSVCLFVGAQKGLLTQEQISDYLAKAPGDYKLKKYKKKTA
jgi:sugar/nucleoside kinase (ribokinase family)